MPSASAAARPSVDVLVACARRGDAVALDALCAAVRPPLLRFCRRVLADRHDAEDATQDTLLAMSCGLATYDGRGSFMGWVYAIAGHEAARAARRRGRALAQAAVDLDAALLHDHEPMTEAQWRLVEQEAHVACTFAVVALLSDAERVAYLLGDVLAVPDRVGAELAGVTPAAFRKRLSRARRAVRAHVAHASGVGTAPAPVRQAAAPSRLTAKARALHRLTEAGDLRALHAAA